MVVLQFKTATRNGCIISCAKRAMVAFVHESLNYVAMNPASGMWSCALLKWVTVVVVLNLEGGLTDTVYKQFEDLRPWQIIFACWSDMLRWFETLINSGSNSADMGRRAGEEVVHLLHWCCIKCKYLQLEFPGRQILAVVFVISCQWGKCWWPGLWSERRGARWIFEFCEII